VLEVRRDLDLGEESLDSEHGAEVRLQDLERDVPVVPQVAREIDGGHSARADLTLDLIVVRQRRAELTEGIHASRGWRVVMPVETVPNIGSQEDWRKAFLG
jgi:hypothetical protein